MSEFGFICFPEKDTFYRYNFRRLPLSRENELTEFLPFTREFMEKMTLILRFITARSIIPWH